MENNFNVTNRKQAANTMAFIETNVEPNFVGFIRLLEDIS